jgi:serine/threonine-protein kinase RsbW
MSLADQDGTHVVRFRMPSRREAVGPAVERVLAAVVEAGLSEEQRHDLAVAAAEALSNAAVHGNRLASDKAVRVIVRVSGGCAVVEIADHGPGFDRSAVHDPTHPERVLVPGGRGVFLMQRLVDDLEYNGAGNRVRLTLRRRD